MALAISPIVQLIHIYIYIHTTHNIHIYLESRVMLSLNSNARVMVSYMREYIDVHAILSRRPWHCLSLIQCSNVRLLFMVCSARRSIVTYIYIYIQHDIGGVLLQRSHKQRMKKKTNVKNMPIPMFLSIFVLFFMFFVFFLAFHHIHSFIHCLSLFIESYWLHSHIDASLWIVSKVLCFYFIRFSHW